MPNRNLIGLQNQKAGAFSEEAARMQLQLMGVEETAVIYTSWKPVRWFNKKKRIAQIVTTEKVSADISGILPGGRRVLAEVKKFDGERLVFSRLKPHQHERLKRNNELGGLSLLVWVCYGEIIIMDYGRLVAAGFKSRTSINREMAENCLWEGIE